MPIYYLIHIQRQSIFLKIAAVMNPSNLDSISNRMWIYKKRKLNLIIQRKIIITLEDLQAATVNWKSESNKDKGMAIKIIIIRAISLWLGGSTGAFLIAWYLWRFNI